MPSKKQQVAPPIVGTKTASPGRATSSTTTTSSTSSNTPASSTLQKNARVDATAYSTIVNDVWSSYQHSTPQSLKLIDVFLAFLMFTGATQFAYCLLVGNYPFNAFLSGFTATVGQFVLTGNNLVATGSLTWVADNLASLRSQCNIANVSEFPKVTPER